MRALIYASGMSFFTHDRSGIAGTFELERPGRVWSCHVLIWLVHNLVRHRSYKNTVPHLTVPQCPHVLSPKTFVLSMHALNFAVIS